MNFLLNPSISQILLHCSSVFKINEKCLYSKFPGLSIVSFKCSIMYIQNFI